MNPRPAKATVGDSTRLTLNVEADKAQYDPGRLQRSTVTANATRRKLRSDGDSSSRAHRLRSSRPSLWHLTRRTTSR